MLLHEQYEDADGRRVLFECDECGFVSLSLGSTHAHCERHRGYTRFGIQVPFTGTAPGKVSELMEMTTVLAVSETSRIGLEDVEGL